MQYRFHGNAAHIEAARALIERKAHRLDQHFADTAEDLKMLDVSLHHHEKTDSYRARLLFRAPGRQLAADGHADTLDYAIRRAFDDLYDQVDRYLAELRREPDIRRAQLASRAELQAELEAEPGPIEPRSEETDAG
ncbi:MAG: HPF/RaiA family ribosome-associated protein [Sphaerobacter sp.]|nr:HPF/RaiA family ribosome-associated protein [Sphaerobacter sp.]